VKHLRWHIAIAVVSVGLLAFSVFAVTLLVDVRGARASLDHDVRWLVAVQRLDQAAGQGAALEPGMRAVAQLSADATPSARTAQALAVLERAVAANDAVATREACAELTKALRGQTAELSERLGSAWARLSILVGASLALALATLVLLVAFARVTARLVARTARERQDAVDESSRLAESLQALAGQVTHDIANPLAFIASNYRFLEGRADELGLSADVREALRDSGEGLKRLERLVRGLQAATALSRSGERARAVDALNAVLVLVEPRVLKTSTLVRAFERLDGCTVRPVPFMRLMNSLLVEAAELCGPGGGACVTVGGEGAQVRVQVDGPLARSWAPSLKVVAAELAFELSLSDRPAIATVTLR